VRACSEKDLSEVLQIEQVYQNVTSGKLANKKVLEKAFPETELKAIILEILKRGAMFYPYADDSTKGHPRVCRVVALAES